MENGGPGRDLNRRQIAYEATALTAELQARNCGGSGWIRTNESLLYGGSALLT